MFGDYALFVSGLAVIFRKNYNKKQDVMKLYQQLDSLKYSYRIHLF